MSTKALAAVLREPHGRFSIETIELDVLRSDEVLVRNEASGICHTDLLARERMRLPAVFGHEGVGVIEAVGSGVTRVRPGDRVVLSYPFCGSCPRCERGEPYLCGKHMELAFGGTRLDGTRTITLRGQPASGAFFQQSSFATHSIALERAVVPFPGGPMGPGREGPQSQLLAAIPCGVQTGAGAILNTFRVSVQESLAVFGVGAVGLSAVMAGHLVGASPLIAVDIVPERLDLAIELGATHVVNARAGDVAAHIRDITRGGVEYALETSGSDQALDDAILSLGSGGRCGMVIAPHLGKKYPFSPSEIFTRAASLVGIIQGSAVPRVFLRKLVTLHEAGWFPFERLIKSYELSEINEAVADMKAGRTIKPVLRMPA